MTEPLYPIQAFKYEPPAELKRSKEFVQLARTDINRATVQVISEGGENNLHSHSAQDGFWFVLAGRARFYGTDDQLIGEFGRYEGVMLPRNHAYWFESSGDEPLQILQVEAKAQALDEVRTNYTPLKASYGGPAARQRQSG
jgi:mannose-6-phosphate isomerase-like protein (cupin superfamily)